MSGRLGELDLLSGFKPGVVRLVETIVGAFACRNSRSSNGGGAKVKIKAEGVLLIFFPKCWTSSL